MNREIHIGIRILFHILLAVFIANAANKFFVPDLEYEFDNGFYERIFQFQGDAPDQYRILPLLPLALIVDFLPFNHAVILYNIIFSFIVLELLAALMKGLQPRKIFLAQILFAATYIYAQFSGWRPDTMGLMAISSSLILATTIQRRPLRETLLTLGLLALAFARADIAFWFAFFLAVYETSKWSWRIIWLGIPILSQLALQFVIFPDAVYYSKKVMLWDNLSGFYLVRHPGTYLILAALLVFRKSILAFLKKSWNYKWFYASLIGYLGLVLIIGRLNEYRLYLPFLPILYLIWRKTSVHENEETGPV